MSATPLLVISSEGLRVASIATPTGPFINLRSFAVGSAFGYDVTKDQTELLGEKLYEGSIVSYSFSGDNILTMVCRLPPDAGPFDFGEVAVYLDEGTMFAKAAFSKMQTKYSSLGTNLACTYTFNIMLKLDQSVAVFRIIGADGAAEQTLLTVSSWSEVVPPELSANPNLPLVLVQELDDKGDSTLLAQSTNQKWTPQGNYFKLGDFTAQNASAVWVEIPASQWPYLDSKNSPYPVEDRSLVVETSDGYFRSVASIQHINKPVTAVRLLLNPDPLVSIPSTGSSVVVYVNDPSIGNSYSLWVNLRKLISNSIQPLEVTLSKPSLASVIQGAGTGQDSISVSATGNAPFTYQWSNVSGNASFDTPEAASTAVRAQIPNGGQAAGVIQCEVKDSFGLSTIVTANWSYRSELAWVVPTQAMFPGSTSFAYDSVSRKTTVKYATAGAFQFTPPNTATAIADLISGGGGGGGGAKVPSGNSNYAWGGAGGGGGAGAGTRVEAIPLVAGAAYQLIVGKGGTGGKSVLTGLAETGVSGGVTSAFDQAVPGGFGGEGAYSFCCGADPGYGRGGAPGAPSGGTGGRGGRGGSGPAGSVHVGVQPATGSNAGSPGADGLGGYCGGGAGAGGDFGQIGGDGGDAGGQSGSAGRKGGGGGGSSGGWDGGVAAGPGGDGEITIVFG